MRFIEHVNKVNLLYKCYRECRDLEKENSHLIFVSPICISVFGSHVMSPCLVILKFPRAKLALERLFSCMDFAVTSQSIGTIETHSTLGTDELLFSVSFGVSHHVTA